MDESRETKGHSVERIHPTLSLPNCNHISNRNPYLPKLNKPFTDPWSTHFPNFTKMHL